MYVCCSGIVRKILLRRKSMNSPTELTVCAKRALNCSMQTQRITLFLIALCDSMQNVRLSEFVWKMEFDIKKCEQSYYLYSVSGTSGNVTAPGFRQMFSLPCAFWWGLCEFLWICTKNQKSSENEEQSYELHTVSGSSGIVDGSYGFQPNSKKRRLWFLWFCT